MRRTSARRDHASAPWTGVIPERVRRGARSAVAIGALAALTALFVFGGVVAVAAVASTLGRWGDLPAALVALVGTVSAHAVAPTLARVAVGAAVERFDRRADPDQGRGSDRGLDRGRDADEPSDEWRYDSSGANERVACGAVCCD